MPLRQWLEHGRRLGVLGRGAAWWIGDWLRYGNERYGEKYVRAARVTGYDAQSLMNMVYVASRFDASRRRETLSWSHHAELAALEPAEQDHWLDVAVEHGLSVHSLRLELRSARSGRRRHVNGAAAASADGRGGDGPGEARSGVCLKCGHVIAAIPSERRLVRRLVRIR